MAWIGDDGDTPSREELAELREILDLVGLSTERIKQILRMAAMDRDVYKMYVEMYRPHVEEIEGRDTYYDWDYPFEPYDGDFRIGTNPEGTPVGLTPKQLNEHMLIVGRTGAGKTTLFYNLMDECVLQGLPFLVFDFKNDYRHLAGHWDLLVVNWRDLKFNPLQPPPDVSVERWAEVMADTWTHAMGLWKASRGYFIRKLRELYGYYDTDAGEWPSLFELLELVGRMSCIESMAWLWSMRPDDEDARFPALGGPTYTVDLRASTDKLPTVVIEELQEIAPYDDVHGRAAATVLEQTEAFETQMVNLDAEFPLDDGENAAVSLANELDAALFLCDEFNQLGLIHASLADTRLVTTPTLLSVLVRTEQLSAAQVQMLLDEISDARSWDSNSYVQRARTLLEEP